MNMVETGKNKELLANELLDIEDVLKFSRQDIREGYRRFINPGLANVMALINFDKQFVKAQDVRLWDIDGLEYLDFLGGYGSLNLGHNPPVVLEAVKKVMERPNILQASLNALAAGLAQNLAAVTPGDLQMTFFCNSGAEAVEGALKLARAYNQGRPKIIYCHNSFHGKTTGALSVTGRDKYRAPFMPLLPNCEPVAFGDLSALEAKLSAQDVAAFIVEPIQGEGGVLVPPEGYLAGARELCDRYGSLLIVDEIQTGFGRTGRLFACDHEGVVPDIMCLSKSLGGGVMPVGAFISRPRIWEAVYGGIDKYAMHTSTFGGNTLAMAAGLASLKAIIEQGLAEKAAENGRYLIERIRELNDKHDLIKEVRGKGLLIGIEFNQPVSGIWNKLTAGKVNHLAYEYFGSLVAGDLIHKYQIVTAYTLNNPNVIRLEPPLTVQKQDIDKVVAALGEILQRSFAGIMAGSVKSTIKSILKK